MDTPISRHYFTLRCTPVSDERQKILHLQRFVFPCDYLEDSRDEWGNALLYGCCRGEHTRFEANICGQAVTGLSAGTPAGNFAGAAAGNFAGAAAGNFAGTPAGAGPRISERDRLFQFATSLTTPDAPLLAFSRSLDIRTGSPREVFAVMSAVHDALTYEPGTTNINTTAAQAFALGHGVCQDYSHVMIAVLRAAGIPARYVAGMLMGEGESHAWVEVLHEGIWYPYDPTNNLVITDEHIKLSHGRDAADCSINRGVFRGFGRQTTEISVIVTEHT